MDVQTRAYDVDGIDTSMSSFEFGVCLRTRHMERRQFESNKRLVLGKIRA